MLSVLAVRHVQICIRRCGGSDFGDLGTAEEQFEVEPLLLHVDTLLGQLLYTIVLLSGSVSAMALDMGLPATPLSMDVSSKKACLPSAMQCFKLRFGPHQERLGTPGMGSRCSSAGPSVDPDLAMQRHSNNFGYCVLCWSEVGALRSLRASRSVKQARVLFCGPALDALSELLGHCFQHSVLWHQIASVRFAGSVR